MKLNMTLKEYIDNNPCCVVTKEDKQWNGYDLYEVCWDSTQEDMLAGPPVYLILKEDGLVEYLDEDDALEANNFLRSDA